MGVAPEGRDLMLTGRQIREARGLLGRSPSRLAEQVGSVTIETVKMVESPASGPPVAERHLKAIRQTLEALGVEFAPEGVRLRKVDP